MDFPGYNVLENIHRSPRTAIFRARRHADGARVVIKALAREYPEPEEQARLAFEHHVLQRLELPGVIRVHDLLEHSGRSALVLEDFPGDSLARIGCSLSTEQVIDVALTLARTLGEIHARGVVHKDVNPGNVLFDPNTASVRLIDFELASELRRERLEPSVRLEGSPAYVSPEQTGRINRDLDYRTDYYSLGVSLFELLTGQLPFSANDTLGWIHCHISKPAPRVRELVPGLPSALGRIVERLLEKDPARRYQSARGLAHDLEECRGRLHAPEFDYELGTHDVSHLFRVSEELVGRDAELATLLQAYGRAASGQPTLVLIAGPAGIGKSSLARELHKHVLQQRGAFASGKFDQLERKTPHEALIQALTRLCKQRLGEPDERLAEWRRRLLAALGANARLMTELVPQLQSILGEAPELSDLAGKDAELRFRGAVAQCVRALAPEGHPLALFLDDLQWMDSCTHQLLLDLCATDTPCHLLLIGAYRDDEVRPGHLLRQAIADLRERAPQAVHELVLAALDAEAVTRIVAATLSSDAASVAPLTGILLEKTEGNPHFIGELLEELYRLNAFHFLPDAGRWGFDADAIERARLGSSYAETIARRLHDLPGDTLQLLQIAACIGNRFELGLLARASDRSVNEVVSSLARGVEQRLIVAEGAEYRVRASLPHGTDLGAEAMLRFQHDRVQAAAYALLDAAERAALHLEIGRLLLASSPEGERGERLLEIVNHLNMGCEHLSTCDERTSLAVLNTRAGRRAKRAAAYAIAAVYFESAALLLGDEEPTIQSQSLAPECRVGLAVPDRLNRFDLLRERLECVFAAGDIERAATLADELAPLAPSPLARAAIYDLQAGVLEHRGDSHGSLELVRRGLDLLGVSLPVAPEQVAASIEQGIGRMQEHLARVSSAELVRLPLLSDAQRLMQMSLLARAIPAAVALDRGLFILLELTMFDLSLSHGVCAASGKNFVDVGIIQGPILGDYERAYALGQAGLQLIDRLQAASYRGSSEFVFGGFVSHWRAPLSESMVYYRAALRHCEEAGDIQHASYACVHMVLGVLAHGVPLPECKAALESALARFERLRASNQGALLTALEHEIDALIAGPSTADGSHGDPGEHNIAWRYTLAQARALVCLMLGDARGAERWSTVVESVLDNVAALASLPEYHMVAGLARCQRLPELDGAARAELDAQIQAQRAKLELWAAHSPHNYRHMQLLLRAEHERARAAPLTEWLDLYGEAVQAAGEGFIQHRALARELESRAWLARGNALIARTFMREAYHLYRQWGARHKLALLAERHPTWFVAEHAALPTRSLWPSSPRPAAAHQDTLDLASIIKATGAISSEVKSDALFRRLMSILIESAGAQRGFLILTKGGALEIVAGASVDSTAHEPLPQALEQSRELCADVVRYVARSHESLVVGDASAAGDYTRDPYVTRTNAKSMLGVPILQQGVLLGVLYADNHVTRHAFDQARIELLELIAGQAAISISNAQLYEQLEQRVAERTRSLAEKTHQIEAMFGAMKQGICLIDAELRVQPQYSRQLPVLLGTDEIAGKSCLELLFADSDVSPGALRQMELALTVCFGGSSLSASVNAGHLVRELKRPKASGELAYYELDWSFVEDDGGDVATVLLVVRDVSLLRKWQADAEQGAREVRLLTEILRRGVDEFHELVDGASELLRQSRGLLVGMPTSPQAALGALFRNMHTIKGNASVLGYSYLVEAAHRAENAYAELRTGVRLDWDRERLRRGLDEVEAQIDEYHRICERKLRGVSGGPSQRERELAAQLHAIEHLTLDGELSPALIVERVRELSRRPFARSLERLLAETARGLEPVARTLDKPMPAVRWLGPDARVGDAWGRALGYVFVHALKNSLDHGIEPMAERLARAKPAQGSIVVQLEQGDGGAVLSVKDDGRGLDLAALARHSVSGASDQDVADTIFRPGVSTASSLTELSGRGVGMDAIRGFVRELGGEVRLALGANERDGRRRFALLVQLPSDALLASPGQEREPASELRSAS